MLSAANLICPFLKGLLDHCRSVFKDKRLFQLDQICGKTLFGKDFLFLKPYRKLQNLIPFKKCANIDVYQLFLMRIF